MAFALCFAAGAIARGALLYVDAHSSTPLPPYADWSTAAQTIQDAVDAAVPGDEISVTNGIYNVGGRAVYGTNRVAVDKAVTVRSVNGPRYTFIVGQQVAGAIRCVYLTNDASLSGFTLTNGGAGWAGYWTDYTFEQSGGAVFCQSSKAWVSNCVIAGNAASQDGGGVYSGTLDRCTLVGNSAGFGGGAYSSALSHCILENNIAATEGGGAAGGTLDNCALTENQASMGGGATGAKLNNCTLAVNSAVWSGGGSYYCWMTNCIVFFNSATDGSNDTGSFLSYCCTTPIPGSGLGNISSDPWFVDLASGDLRLLSNSPCINAGNNVYAIGPTDLGGNPRIVGGVVDMGAYESQRPLGPVSPYFIVQLQPTNQSITVSQDVTFSVVAGGSPPLSYQWRFNGSSVPDATNASLTLTYAQRSQSGMYTVVVTNLAGALVSGAAVLSVNLPTTRYVDAQSANPAPPYTNWATAAQTIQDAIDTAAFFDEILVTNGLYATGGQVRTVTNGYYTFASTRITNRVAIIKPITVRSMNGPQFTFIQGWSVQPATITDGTRCVYLTNGASLSGFTLTNGTSLSGFFPSNDYFHQMYGGGAWCEGSSAILSNCVMVNCTAASGGGGVYFGTLYGCTLTADSAPSGGGASGSTLYNCTISSNHADWPGGGGSYYCTSSNCTLVGNSASFGGGAEQGTLINCTLIGNTAEYGAGADSSTLTCCTLLRNSATSTGGGARSSNLSNCTVAGNSADYSAGGVDGVMNDMFSSIYNSIVYFNTAPSAPNYAPANATLNYSCTAPLPAEGPGNIAADPLFVDFASGDLHLQPSSPCINAGNNLFAPQGTDLDGNPRIIGGVVDIGAYEFQGPTAMTFQTWLQSYGLPTDGSADYADTDADGMNNWQEWVCGTDPTNRLSVLRMLPPTVTSSNVIISWQSVPGVNYFVERTTGLGSPGFSLVGTNIVGQSGTNFPGLGGITTFMDSNPPPESALLYRVGVRH